MLKKIVLMFLSCFSLLTCQPRKDRIEQTVIPDEEIFMILGSENRLYGINIWLYKDKSYYIAYSGETGGEYAEGTYELTDQELILREEYSVPIGYAFLPENPAVFKRVQVEDSLFTDEIFTHPTIKSFDNLDFADRGRNLPVGTSRTIEGFEVVTTGLEVLEVTDPLRIRKGPGRDFDYYKGIVFGGESPVEVLPPGHQVISLARTTVEDNINGISGFWHYCLTVYGWYDSGPRYGWLFEGYLKKAEITE